MRGMPAEPNSLETWLRILRSCSRNFLKSFLLAYQRERQGSITGMRKPVGWIFCPMFLAAVRSGLALLHLLLRGRVGHLAHAHRQVREALLERHRPALRTRSPAQPAVEQRAVVGAALADHQAVDVDRLVLAGVVDGAVEHLGVEARAAL